MSNDKADIAKWAVDNKISVKEKVGIWGWSYGGYATLSGLAFHPDIYACGISMYAPTEFLSFGKSPFAINNERWKMRVGDVNKEEDIDELKKCSPFNYVKEFRVPVLMTTGSKDDRVPQSQMDTMASALKNAGKDVTYFYYPDEGHDYRSPASWMSFWAVGEQFLSDKLGGKYEKKGDDIATSDMVIVEGKKFIEALK